MVEVTVAVVTLVVVAKSGQRQEVNCSAAYNVALRTCALFLL
jgi:hypothetical protein